MKALNAVDFSGKWLLERVIDDRHGIADATMSGQAIITQRGPADLQYCEIGKMRIANGPLLEARREYLWRFAAGQVVVTFADNTAFHSFVPAGHSDGTDHPCGKDHYKVRYDFTRWPRWRATWTVIGPRKDYTSVSDYSPI